MVCSDSASTTSKNWLSNELYTLTLKDVFSPMVGSDSVIQAAQLLIMQEFPHMSGLQEPVLAQTLGFQVHRGEFVQIICVGHSHWCTVLNIGCDEGVVKVYDSLYSSVSNVTFRV